MEKEREWAERKSVLINELSNEFSEDLLSLAVHDEKED